MMSDPTFHKGQDVWYINKDGQQVPAKVTGVDLSIRPVAYSVRLEGADHDRDTESPRLRPRAQNSTIEKPLASAQVVAQPEPQYAFQKAPVSQNAYMAKFENDEPEFEDDYGDFGDFKAADSPVLGPRFAQVPQFQSPRKNVRNEEQNEMKPEIGIRSSENNKASLIASQSEKKPGESQSGIFGKPGSGPIPLDIFGEDDVPQKDVPSFENLYGPRHTPGGQNFSRGLNLPPTFHPPGNKSSPKKPYKPAAEIQNPYIRAMFQNENPDSDNRPNQLPRPNPVRFAQGSLSPAGSSDDFGDFEDAPQEEDLNPGIQIHTPYSPSQRRQREAAKKLEPILQKSHKDWAAEHTNSISKAIFPSEIFQRNSDNFIPDQVTQKQNETKPDVSRQAETQVLGNKGLKEKQEESQEDEADEIPWYMDPVSFLQSQTNNMEERKRPEFAEQSPQSLLLKHTETIPEISASPNWNSFEGYQGNGGEIFRESPRHPKLINSHHLQSPRHYGQIKGNFEERSQHPLTREDVLSALNFENKSHRAQAQNLSQRESNHLFQPAQSSTQNPYEGLNQYSSNFQPDFRTSHPTNHNSTFQHPNSLRETNRGRNFTSESPNNYSHYLSAPEYTDSRLRYGRNLKRRQTYPEMWTQMMQTCAEALENGQSIVREEQERKRVERLLASQRGKNYLEALAQIHLAYQLLDSSMKVHVPEERRPSAFRSYAEQCSQAWNSDVGSMPLEDVVLRVSPLARQTSFELPRQAIRAIETSPEWRGWNQGEGYQEPEWREGLCGITLLPVDELRDLHFAPWIEDRPCLILLANLWKNRIHNDPPDLASRTSFSQYR